MKTNSIELARGFNIIEKQKEMDLYSADFSLKSARQKRYTKAKRIGDSAILTYHIIKCPYCGKEYPAYEHFFNNKTNYQRKDDLEIKEWSKIQISLFETDDELYFQNPISKLKELKCKKCGNDSSFSENKHFLIFEESNNTVCIKRELKNFKDLVDLKWPKNTIVLNVFSLYESIVFDFVSGEALIKLTDENNKIFASMNVFENLERLSDNELVNIINKYKVIKRRLKQGFDDNLDKKTEISVDELEFTKFVYLVRFQNFSKEFYEYLPCGKSDAVEDVEFVRIAEKLKNHTDAIKMFTTSKLPQSKSIKKVFLESPQWLFYLKEFEILYEIIDNINIFHKIVTNERVGNIIATLHIYPGAFEFLRDCCNSIGAIKLSKYILISFDRIITLATKYSCLNDYDKQKEQKKWKEDKEYFKQYFRKEMIDWCVIPMKTPPKNIPDISVCGYSFKWLKTTRDYFQAAAELHNCLKSWKVSYPPVLAVHKNGKIVAAIEVDNHSITQAYEASNGIIDENSGLYRAICNWAGKFGISWEHDEE